MDVARGGAVEADGVDRWGWMVPMVCAVHCLAAPVMLVIVPAFASSPLVEGALMAVAFLFAVPIVLAGVQVHGRATVWLPIAFGSLLWIAELAEAPIPAPGTVLTVSGSLLVAMGLVLNSRLRARARSACVRPAPRPTA
jgi:hypothetical protein